ncbi:MAG: hypothetical protein AAF585_06640, partial [Verrucomicrobiota bacterium]
DGDGDDAAESDSGDNTTGVKNGGGFGQHLIKTVFEIDASVQNDPSERNWYNHSYCVNRSLITDTIYRRQSKPEFTPRNRNLFKDDAATALIIEGTEGDRNSIGVGDMRQINEAAKRYDDKFVHVGFMDGHVERIKLRNFPTGTGSDENSFFWTGLDQEDYQAYEKNSTGSVNY